MNRKLILTTLALGGLGASTVAAQAFQMAGSDTLFTLTRGVISRCETAGTIPAGDMLYQGGGSGTGGTAMTNGLQEMAPQSRFMNAAECTGSTGVGNGRPVALDAIAIWKDKTERQFTCPPGFDDCNGWPSFDEGGLNKSDHGANATPLAGNAATGGDCRVIRYAGCMAIQDLNGGSSPLAVAGSVDDGTGAAGVLGPAGNAAIPLVNGQYCFTHWADALRIIYFGQHQHMGDGSNGTSNNGACATNPTVVGNVTQTASSTRRCNSDVRRTLVENWSNLFDYVGDDGAGGCVDKHCTRLKHAWRRDDLSGTTDTFVTLLGVPPTGTGNPLVPQRTFCNGLQNEDLDPIRRECNRNTNASLEPDGVCSAIPFVNRNAPFSAFDGSPTGAPGATAATPPTATQFADLGLVLAISIPEQPTGVDQQTWLNRVYPNAYCATAAFGGTFKFVPMQTVALPQGQRCPDGNARVAGQCRWPVASGTLQCNCSARRTNRPGGITWANFDARAYNVLVRDPATCAILNPNFSQTGDARWAGTGHYRIHDRLSKPSQTGAVLKGVHPACKLPDSTEQIGCLVEADMCSIGFAGLAASDPTPPVAADGVTAIPYTNGSVGLHSRQFTSKTPTEVGVNWPLLLRANKDVDTADVLPAGGTPRVYTCDANLVGWWGNPSLVNGDFELDALEQLKCDPASEGNPNVAAIGRVLDPSGVATCKDTGDYDIRYPLSRLLWVNAKVGIANVQNGNNVGAGTAPAPVARDHERDLLNSCYLNDTILTPSVDAAGFLPLPGGVNGAQAIAASRTCP